MATATQRTEPRTLTKHLDSQPAAAPKRRRWLFAAIATAGLLGALVCFLPSIVAHSPISGWIVAAVAGDLNGKVTADSISLGWFSPIGLADVEIRDPEDELILKTPQVSGDKSLMSVLWNIARPGRFRIEEPRLNVVLYENGSNLEDVLAAYLAPSDEPPAELDLGLEIVDGQVTISDQSTQRTWQIEKLQLALSMSIEGSRPLELQASGVVADRKPKKGPGLICAKHPPGRSGKLNVGPFSAPGSFEVALKMPLGDQNEPASEKNPPADKTPTTGSLLTIKTDAVPLEIFELLSTRLDQPDMHLAGRLSSDAKVEWGDGPGEKLSVQATATADDFLLSAPVLGEDRVQLKRLKTACKIVAQKHRLDVGRLDVDSDLGKASLAGSFQLGHANGGELLASLPRQTYEFKGKVDLARLAAMLPGTLHIHQGTQVTAGQLKLALASRSTERGMVWQGRIETSDLTALRRGKELVWQQPILITLAAHETEQGLLVENLKCESHFLKIHATGTPQNLSASASFDLDRLAQRLGGFVDLGGVRMAGQGWANLNWKRSKQQIFEADAELQVRDLQLAVANRPAWEEENLLIFLSGTGRTDFGVDTRLDTAKFEIRSGQEQITARITEPVLDFRRGGRWPVALKAKGDLARWTRRARAWIAKKGPGLICAKHPPGRSGKLNLVPFSAWKLNGTYDLHVQGTGSASSVEIRQARCGLRQLGVSTDGLNIVEPTTELTLAGRWDRSARRLLVKTATLASRTVSVRADDVMFGMPENDRFELAGDLRYEGDLQRLQGWIIDPAEPPTWKIAGRFSGNGRLKQTTGTTTGKLDATISNLTVVGDAGKQYREKQVRLTTAGVYQHQARLLSLDTFKLTSAALNTSVSGRVSENRGRTDVQLTGQIGYDIERVCDIFKPYLGDGVRMIGRGTSPISYRGPTSLAQAQAEAGLGWAAADVYGFQVGPGQLKATLADGMLQIQPVELDVSEGCLHLAPKLRLAPEPLELQMEPGPFVSDVRINPTMCAYGLQYIAPILAGGATAEGRFSIELDGCRIPLADPTKGELAGKFIVHSVQIGPGPLVRELAVLLGGGSAAKLTRESSIEFCMVQGRVYHQGLELVFPDLTIRTYGSVGVTDHTLAMMAEMPVPPVWLAHRDVAAALRNQTIRLPIGGTLERPRLDRRVLDQLSRQFAQKAVQNVIEDQLNKQLDRLLNPKR